MSETPNDFRRPPGPSTPMPFGVDPETLERLLALQGEYGEIACFNKPSGRLAYFVNDPVEVRKILVRRHTRYVKGPGFERVKMLLGNGLIVSDGDVWRRSRTMIQPAFKVQNVHRLMKVMVECADHRAVEWAKANDVQLQVGRDPHEAVAGADCVVTDTWVSMSDDDATNRHNLLMPYQVNDALMASAGEQAIFMHCLPAHRDEEVAGSVIDGPQSVVFDEAENRLHAQKAILRWCLGKL